LVLVLALVVVGVASTPAVGQPRGEAAAPSIVEIPLRISLDRLYEVAEQEMPREAGNWRDWRQTYGIDTKYRAWRGPLDLAMHGQLLTARAPVRYWIRARKRVLGALDVESSCGVEEAPRRAIIGVQIRLDWGPDWTLHPVFRVMPTRFLDRCEMTFADIDVTPLIAREFQDQLQDRMRAALGMLSDRLAGLRQQVEGKWRLMQQPVPLWAEQWLLLNPAGVALSPLSGLGDRVDVWVAILMQPQVVSDRPSASRPLPLPPLQRFYPRSTGLTLRLEVELDYAGLNRALSEQLSAGALEIEGQRLDIESLKVSGKGQEIHVAARLGGEIAGEASLKAGMRFTPESPPLRVENLSYDYQPDDPWLQAEADLFYGVIRKLLESAANRYLQQYLEQGRQRLSALFEKVAPEGVKPDMGSLRLRQVQLDMAGDAIRLQGLASGRIVLEFR
jgi:hypothetical protein